MSSTHRPQDSQPTPTEIARAAADPSRRAGRYLLLEQLGVGGFGAVFRGWDPDLARWVAVKVLHQPNPRSRQRFVREVQVGARLQHPNIATVHDCGQEGERVYLVMELVDGQSLGDLCDARLPPGRAAEIVRQLAAGVAYAHDQGIWHRDLKPDNVMIDPEGVPRILDFGLAFLTGELEERISRTGAPLGTPAYMAPEQVGGKATQQSDVWGLGGILYHALTGRAAFEGGGHQTLLAVLQHPPQRPSELNPDVPPALEDLCLRCLEKDPLSRPADAWEVQSALSQFLQPRAGKSNGQPGDLAPKLALGIAVFGAAAAAFVVAFAARRGASPVEVATDPATASPTQEPLAAPSEYTASLAELLDEARLLSLDRASFDTVASVLGQARAVAATDAALEQVELELAGLELRRGRLGEAEARLTGRSWQHEGSRAAQLTSAVLLQRKGFTLEVARRCEALLEPMGPSVSLDCARAVVALTQGDVRAKRLIEEAAAQAPDQAGPQMLLARMHQALRNPRAALRPAELARELAPDDHRVYSVLQDLHRETGDKAQFLEAVERLVELLEDHATGKEYVLRSTARQLIGDHRGAMADLDLAMARDPQDALPVLQRGLVRLQDGDEDGATKDLLRAVKLDPTEVEKQLRSLRADIGQRARALIRSNLPAPPIIQERLARVPPAARPALSQSLLAAFAGRPWGEVSEPLRRAVAASPDSPAMALEEVALTCGRDVYDDALRAIARAKELGADPLELERRAIDLEVRMTEHVKGARLDALATTDPAGFCGLWAKALSLAQSQDPQAALPLVRMALERRPRDPLCLFLRASAVAASGDLQEGLRSIDTAFELCGWLDTRVPLTSYELRLVALERSMRRVPVPNPRVWAEANELFSALEQASAGGTTHYTMRGTFYLARSTQGLSRTLPTAREMFEKAEAREPNSPYHQIRLGWVACKEGDLAQALKRWRRARARDPEAKLNPYHLKAYTEAGGDLDTLEAQLAD